MNPEVSENLQKAQFPSLTRIQSFFSVRSKCSVPEAIILAFGLVQLSQDYLKYSQLKAKTVSINYCR